MTKEDYLALFKDASSLTFNAMTENHLGKITDEQWQTIRAFSEFYLDNLKDYSENIFTDVIFEEK